MTYRDLSRYYIDKRNVAQSKVVRLQKYVNCTDVELGGKLRALFVSVSVSSRTRVGVGTCGFTL